MRKRHKIKRNSLKDFSLNYKSCLAIYSSFWPWCILLHLRLDLLLQCLKLLPTYTNDHLLTSTSLFNLFPLIYLPVDWYHPSIIKLLSFLITCRYSSIVKLQHGSSELISDVLWPVRWNIIQHFANINGPHNHISSTVQHKTPFTLYSQSPHLFWGKNGISNSDLILTYPKDIIKGSCCSHGNQNLDKSKNCISTSGKKR